MKLLSFKISNYRSIVDSGWCDLSPDNITGILGQNESGKTSVLEALRSFYSGVVSEEILRSDLSNPIVSCCFTIDSSKFEEVLSEKKLPEGVISYIRKTGKLCLTRHWDTRLRSLVELNGHHVSLLYNKHEETKRRQDAEIQTAISEYLKERDEIVAEAEGAEVELKNEAKNLSKATELLSEAKKEFKLLRKTPNEKFAEEKLNEAKKLLEIAKKTCEDTDKSFDVKRQKADAVLYQARIADSSAKAEEEYNRAKKRLKEAFNNLANLQDRIKGDLLEIEKRGMQHKLDQLNELHVKAVHEFEVAKEDAIVKKHLAYKVISGTSLSMAKQELQVEKPQINPFYTMEEAGKILFNLVPEFIFFEDFSSLLPDRIDLFDIFDLENLVEGSRAARNYLLVSGLQPGFFSESNTRILKQKIEKLNRDVTLDFQEYWSQQVGRKNKITINFELEHYDNSVPEKSGQPYLEFWIRDKNERLYPKQRSRGVRWFLSFYLELKASGLKNNGANKVMLIDEPGLSLHARAQEDVLKVFDLVKDKVQILYTSHSPHLIDTNKLYRLMAVERAFDREDTSETKFFSANSLGAASTDTLLPIYTMLGSFPIGQTLGGKSNNVILQNVADYYFLNAIRSIVNFKKEVYFIPTQSGASMVSMANILQAWGYNFIVLNGANTNGDADLDKFLENISELSNGRSSSTILSMDNFASLEDLFSYSDFQNLVLSKRGSSKEANSIYLKKKNLSRMLVAARFSKLVEEGKLQLKDFDEESRSNFKWLFNSLSRVLK